MTTMKVARMHMVGGPRPTWFPERPLPPLPAIFGLDTAGEIAAVGSQVHAWKAGDQDMPDMAAAGLLDLSVFEQVKFPLSRVNEAISGIENRNGGFGNVVVNP